MLHQFQTDEAYNYARELEAPDMNIFQWLLDKIFGFLRDLFAIENERDFRVVLYILFALVILGVIAYFIVRFKPTLFSRSGKTVAQSIEENNIYGVDFDAELKKAIKQNDYNRAVCIIYLQTLRWLADNGKISWQIYKTPTQYTREYPRGAFIRFTNLFMRVRYGNYTADAGSVDQMLSLQREIEEGGENES